jgi:hypothetical protein
MITQRGSTILSTRIFTTKKFGKEKKIPSSLIFMDAWVCRSPLALGPPGPTLPPLAPSRSRLHLLLPLEP